MPENTQSSRVDKRRQTGRSVVISVAIIGAVVIFELVQCYFWSCK